MDGQGDWFDFAHGINSQASQLFILNITWQGLLTNETRNAVLQEVLDILDQISEASDEDADNIDILQDSEIEVGAEVEVDVEDGQNVGREEEQDEPCPEDIGIDEVHDGNVMNDPLPGGSRKRGREEDSDEEESSIRHAPRPPRDEEDEESSNMYRWSWNYSPDSVHYSEIDTDSE
ncbi:Hypothetical predicted protein [Scomber scombrus]|uniref:Uncharacterized protein n=1 Tax=Scomber scombrus TaxID=13677 RepID=A0AAV1PRN9_SCOSC